ncbi:MAG: Uma2 family endonuclease [Leptolyngbyaceae cyanobacterium]
MAYTTRRSIPQTDPPLPPWETLPTMYDLPSEYPEEPGLPDEFHDLQPQLLSRTLHLADYKRQNWFTGSDLNLYYDVHNQHWYKRPDWFLAVGVPNLYNGHDLRRSYVNWQERRPPHVVIEFLSPGTEQTDLGRFYWEDSEPAASSSLELHGQEQSGTPPPDKLTVYERYLRVPHYLTYDRRTKRLRYFLLVGGEYQEQPIQERAPLVWLADLKVGLGLWEGIFEAAPGRWLRWCDAEGNWLLTDTEQERLAKEQERLAKEQERLAKEQERLAKEQERLAKEQERLAKEQAQQKAEHLAERLRSLGVDPDEI